MHLVGFGILVDLRSLGMFLLAFVVEVEVVVAVVGEMQELAVVLVVTFSAQFFAAEGICFAYLLLELHKDYQA